MNKLKLYWCYFKHLWFNEMFQKFKEEYDITPPDVFHKKFEHTRTKETTFYFELLFFRYYPESFFKEHLKKSSLKEILNLK